MNFKSGHLATWFMDDPFLCFIILPQSCQTWQNLQNQTLHCSALKCQHSQRDRHRRHRHHCQPWKEVEGVAQGPHLPHPVEVVVLGVAVFVEVRLNF